MMRTTSMGTALLLTGSWLILGCGKPAAPPTVKSITNTVPVAPQSQVPNPKPNPPNPNLKPKPNDKKSVIPANADPKTLFMVSDSAQRFEVDATSGPLPTDQFLVVVAETGLDSTRFVLDSVRVSVPTKQKPTPQRKTGFALPAGFEEVKEYGYSTEGLPLRILCTKTDAQLALVPAGLAIIGTNEGPTESQPSISVDIDSFYLEVVEVTVRDFEKYRVDQREKKKTVPPAPMNPVAPPQIPVLGVSWGVAVGYARWAGMELPTEAEFEKGTRGPLGFRTPWGDGKALWSNRPITATGVVPTDKSPYGIFDLAGNALEWCADLYSPTAHTEATSSSTKDIPHNWAGPKRVRDMSLRVVKGNLSGSDWSSWNRQGKDMGKGHSDVGFRCVLRIGRDSKATDTKAADTNKSFP